MKKNNVLTTQKAWCIVCLAVDKLFAKHDLYAMKGAKMLMNSEFHQIFYFNLKLFDLRIGNI